MLVEGDLEVVEAAVTTEAQSTDVAEEDMDEVAVEGEPPLAASWSLMCFSTWNINYKLPNNRVFQN